MLIEQMFIQWYNRRILILSSFILLILPLSMISIGFVFFHSCPKSFYLPLHLIICGMTSLIAAICFLIMSIQWKYAIKLTGCHKSKLMILSIVELIFMIICLSGAIILSIVLLQMSNTVQFDSLSMNYCHPIIFSFSYILLILLLILLSTIFILLFFIFHAYQKTQWFDVF